MGAKMAKEMYAARKIVWLFIGYAVIEILYITLRYFVALLPHPGYGGESVWGLLFLVLIPVSIYIGSSITGYHFSKIDNKILKNSIIYNPGLIFSIKYFIQSIDIAVIIRSNQMQVLIGMLMYLLLYMTVSAAGIYSGYRLHKDDSEKVSG